MPIATETTTKLNGSLKLHPEIVEKEAKFVDPYNYVGEVLGDVPADYPHTEFLRKYL